MGTSAGIPSYSLPVDQPGYLSKGFGFINQACDSTLSATGVDFCGGITTAAGKVAGAMLGATMGGGGVQAIMY